MPPKPIKAPKKQRKPLAKASKTKAMWNRRYHKAKSERIAAQIKEHGYSYSELTGERSSELDGHHPNGQAGKWILNFKLCTRSEHNLIHLNPNQARKKGWLK